MSRVYCSDAARLRGDDNSATASRVDVWILVELAAHWGREPIRDAAIPAVVRQSLKRAGSEIPRSRVVFIRRRLGMGGPVRVYVGRSAPVASVTEIDVPSLEDVAAIPFASLAAPPRMAEAPALRRPLVLVCTHGQHDSCCGRRGYPLYDALRQQEELEVWQCSHIGGDRFAANAIVLPWGQYYGPVEPREAEALTAAILRDEIYLPAYRGRSSVSRPAQFAETFVRRTHDLTQRDSIRVISREELSDDRVRIVLRDHQATTHEVTIEHTRSEAELLLTCSATMPSAVPLFRVVDYRNTPGTGAPTTPGSAP